MEPAGIKVLQLKKFPQTNIVTFTHFSKNPHLPENIKT